MTLRGSRLWQDSLAHATIYEGDAGECAKWLGYAKQKLQFMLHNTAGPLTATFNPAADVTVRVDTRPNRIYIKAGEDTFILRLAADGHEVGWGKPYGSGLGTPGGYNPWLVVKTNTDGTEATIKKGLPVTYFDNNDEITYSDTPNTGNCYWGTKDTGVLTWLGPYNQIGPIDIDGDDSYGGTLSDAYLTNAAIAIDSPTGRVYVSDQFGKKVFKGKKTVAEFTNYVLAACESVGVLGGCVIALTATSLNQCAGLRYKIEVYWLATATTEVKLDIDMEAQHSLFPTYAGAFNLTATECVVMFQLNYLETPSVDEKYVTLENKLRQLKINVTDLSAISHVIGVVPLPEGSDIHKRLYASVGYTDVTAVTTAVTLLTYGYDYSNNTLTHTYLVNSFDSYFGGTSYQTSHIQVGAETYFLGGRSEVHYAFNYTALYGDSPPIPDSDWYYPNSGLRAFLANTVYSNAQRKQFGLVLWTTTQSLAEVPPGYFMPVRHAAHYLSMSEDRVEVIGILSDDFMVRNESYWWPLGNSNTYSGPNKTSLAPSAWTAISPMVDNYFFEVAPCQAKVNGVIPYTPGANGNFNDLGYKYKSKQHLYFNGVSNEKYAFGAFNLKGPFTWYYQTDYTFPIPDDYDGNFKAYVQTAVNTSGVVPSEYSPSLDITSQLGFTTEEMPRIRESKLS